MPRRIQEPTCRESRCASKRRRLVERLHMPRRGSQPVPVPNFAERKDMIGLPALWRLPRPLLMIARYAPASCSESSRRGPLCKQRGLSWTCEWCGKSPNHCLRRRWRHPHRLVEAVPLRQPRHVRRVPPERQASLKLKCMSGRPKPFRFDGAHLLPAPLSSRRSLPGALRL